MATIWCGYFAYTRHQIVQKKKKKICYKDIKTEKHTQNWDGT